MEAGWRFGRLVTLAFYRDNQRPRPHWICVCDCGAFRATESSVSQTEWARRIGVSQPLISLVRSEKIW